MNVKDTLKKNFSAQDFPEGLSAGNMLGKYRNIACNYAETENAIAVLSDLHAGESYIYYGGFAQMLGTDKSIKEVRVPSIWEEEIFRLIHRDDLTEKHLQELYFFNFIKKLPKRKRADYRLASKIRMKTVSGNYIPALHRMFYIPASSGASLWLALCLYSPLPFDIPAKCMIINTVNGNAMELGRQDSAKILSSREKQILALIDKGMTSKEIAAMLSISVNTVSRHRQEILGKLQARNSIEACRTAKDLKLI